MMLTQEQVQLQDKAGSVRACGDLRDAGRGEVPDRAIPEGQRAGITGAADSVNIRVKRLIEDHVAKEGTTEVLRNSGAASLFCRYKQAGER